MGYFVFCSFVLLLFCSRREAPSEHLYGQGHSIAAPQAERGQASFASSVLQGVEQSRQDSRTTGSNRMPQSHRPAVDIDPIPIPT